MNGNVRNRPYAKLADFLKFFLSAFKLASRASFKVKYPFDI